MEKDIFFNVADIVKRAKRVSNFKTDADLAAWVCRVLHLVTGLHETAPTSRYC